MSRAERQAQTRELLLEAAARLFQSEGVNASSIERIAEEAGFSTGAVYSNFKGKEDIFLEVLHRVGNERLDTALEAIEAAPNNEAVVDALAEWADHCSRSGSWSLMVLEHARMVKERPEALNQQIEIIKDHWLRLGEQMKQCFPGISESAEVVGAYLHEIAFAPVPTFVESPTAGELMRVAVTGLLSKSLRRL